MRYTISLDGEPDDRYKIVRKALGNRLIEINEAVLAASAYQKFQELGRGYLFFTTQLVDSVLKIREDIGLTYIPQSSEIYRQAKASEDRAGQTQEFAPMHEAVASYRPQQEFVVVVGFGGEGTDEFPTEFWKHVAPKPSPVQAFSAMRRRPDEFHLEGSLPLEYIDLKLPDGSSFILGSDDYHSKGTR